MTHICVNNLTIIGSGNGLSPGRRQTIIWTNAEILLIGPLGTNFIEILIEIHTFSFKKIHFKMASWKWRPFCLGLNVLRVYHWTSKLQYIPSLYCYKRVPISHNHEVCQMATIHDDVIKWKHFPRYWPFEWGIHRSPVNSPHKGQWRWALMFSLICTWMNGWVNNREAGDMRRHLAHYDVTTMCWNYHPANVTFKDRERVPGVKVTKPVFPVPLFSRFFRMIKTLVPCMI